MTCEEMDDYIRQGGYGYLTAWNPHDCVAYVDGVLTRFPPGQIPRSYAYTEPDYAASSWEVSPSHGDKPPR